MVQGRLYGVSVGPGDPELLTLRAVRVLREVDVVAAPKVGESARAALRIVEPYILGKPVLDCVTPMMRDRTATVAAYDAIAAEITALLEEGKSVAFVTLGDASVYSTWSYVCERMEGRGFPIEVVPGVPSFCAAAAVLREPLCERSGQLLVTPVAAGDPAAALDVPGTKVFMKAGKRLGELRDLLVERGLAADATLVANCGLPGETVVRGLSATGELPGYMSIVVVKDRVEDTRPGVEGATGAPDGAIPYRVRTERGFRDEKAGSTARIPVAFERNGESRQQANLPSGGLAGQARYFAGCADREAWQASRGVERTASLPGSMGVHPQLQALAGAIEPPDEAARQRAQARWDAVAKPLGSLGVLEEDVARIAALTGEVDIDLGTRVVAVLCADNGVVAEGVSQCGSEVTAAVAANIARGVSSVCAMAATARADVFAYDLGMSCPPDAPGIVDMHVARGTGDIAKGPAMARAQAVQAIEAGIVIAADLKARGYGIVVAGEMGIGNTTTASAMASVLLGLPVSDVAGRGAGLSDAGLHRKRAAIERAIAVNAPQADDALDVLARLGGFDIAGLAGLFIGGALHRVPVVIDGLISAVAAYTAARLVPGCECAMLASHVSAEPAARCLLAELGLRPAIDAGLRLGEGTGAVCLLPLLDAALALYNGTTFHETGIRPYERFMPGDVPVEKGLPARERPMVPPTDAQRAEPESAKQDCAKTEGGEQECRQLGRAEPGNECEG